MIEPFTPEQVIQVARDEVLSPKTDTYLENLLQVHKVVLNNGVPVVARAIADEQANIFRVFFPIEGQSYFLVVFVEPNAVELVAYAADMWAAVYVYLNILSDTLPAEKITERLRLAPTSSHREGELRPRSQKSIYPRHVWSLQILQNVPAEVEEKLNALLEILEPAREHIAQLAAECECWIQINYWGYQESMGVWHLPAATLRRISALGIDFGVDLYATGPKLSD